MITEFEKKINHAYAESDALGDYAFRMLKIDPDLTLTVLRNWLERGIPVPQCEKSEAKHQAEETLNEQKTQNHSMPESLSLRAYFMANIRPPFNMSDAWVDQLAGPLRKDELGICATVEEKILQFANAEAEYRRIFADAMIKALTK